MSQYGYIAEQGRMEFMRSVHYLMTRIPVDPVVDLTVRMVGSGFCRQSCKFFTECLLSGQMRLTADEYASVPAEEGRCLNFPGYW